MAIAPEWRESRYYLYPEFEETEWSDSVERVQVLAELDLEDIPPAYVRLPPDRPCFGNVHNAQNQIPVIDFSGLDDGRRDQTMSEIAKASEEWGFFQLLNHGISLSLIEKTKRVAKEFFDLPIEEKQVYANKPWSLVGYGSRIGVTKGAVLDWGDYFLHYLWPLEKRDEDQEWPKKPDSYRTTVDEYTKEIHRLCLRLMEVLSETLGLHPCYIKEKFGGEEILNLVLRINYYPPCPRPELALGVSPHSDGGGLTLLLQDDDVPGLQVHKDGYWMLVEPIPNAIVVNIADQLQILSNGRYKSVEHRVLVNKYRSRMSLATFCNPEEEDIISPACELIDEAHPALYRAMTYKEFLKAICKNGLKGKSYVESFRTKRQ